MWLPEGKRLDVVEADDLWVPDEGLFLPEFETTQDPTAHPNLWIPDERAVEVHTFDEPIDPVEIFMGNIALLRERARHASKYLSESYRNAEVGNCALAYDPENNRVGIITTANFKAKIWNIIKDENDVDEIDKVCAEMDALLRAERNGFTRIIGFVVISNLTPKLINKITGKATETLQPCGACRGVCKCSNMVDDAVLVVTGNVSNDNVQIQTIGEQEDLYSSKTDKEFYKKNPLTQKLTSLDLFERYKKYLQLVTMYEETLESLDGSSKDFMRFALARTALDAPKNN